MYTPGRHLSESETKYDELKTVGLHNTHAYLQTDEKLQYAWVLWIKWHYSLLTHSLATSWLAFGTGSEWIALAVLILLTALFLYVLYTLFKTIQRYTPLATSPLALGTKLPIVAFLMLLAIMLGTYYLMFAMTYAYMNLSFDYFDGSLWYPKLASTGLALGQDSSWVGFVVGAAAFTLLACLLFALVYMARFSAFAFWAPSRWLPLLMITPLALGTGSSLVAFAIGALVATALVYALALGLNYLLTTGALGLGAMGNLWKLGLGASPLALATGDALVALAVVAALLLVALLLLYVLSGALAKCCAATLCAPKNNYADLERGKRVNQTRMATSKALAEAKLAAEKAESDRIAAAAAKSAAEVKSRDSKMAAKSKATPTSPAPPAPPPAPAATYNGITLSATDLEMQDHIVAKLRDGFPYGLFMSWDTDHSGKITKDEFERAVCEMGLPSKPSIVYRLFDFFDKTGDGELDYQELYRHLVDTPAHKAEAVMRKVNKGKK